MATNTLSILGGAAGLALVTTFWRSALGRRLDRDLRRGATTAVQS